MTLKEKLERERRRANRAEVRIKVLEDTIRRVVGPFGLPRSVDTSGYIRQLEQALLDGTCSDCDQVAGHSTPCNWTEEEIAQVKAAAAKLSAGLSTDATPDLCLSAEDWLKNSGHTSDCDCPTCECALEHL